VALADREGPDALSMRRLGRELGVEGMAIYTYFDSKAELLGAVAEELLGELELRPAPGAPWQERVRHVIGSWAALRDRHPGGFPLLYAQRAWATREFEPIEELLDALADAGLPPERSILAYHTLVWMLDGILLSVGYRDDPVSSVWQRGLELVDPAAYPHYVEAAPFSTSLSGRAIYDYGSELLVRGLESLVGEPP
jgi:AcrR family transcriptional regulator